MRKIVWGSILGIYLFAAGGASWGFSQTPAKAEYTSFNLRDPFKKQFLDEPQANKPVVKPKVREAVIPPRIVLDGVVAGGLTPYAIIAGRLLRIGDQVDEAVITAITKEGIEVMYKLEKFGYPSPSKALKSNQEVKNAE